MTNPDNKRPVALIAGPTASGKTALALELAKRRDCVIINADSAQVYGDLPILSAQPNAAEMASAPHKLFGYLDGKDPCSAARWADDAGEAIKAAHRANRLPVLVGGTGLYLRSLIDGIAPMPEIKAVTRDQIRALPTPAAWAALQREDAAIAGQLHPNDGIRIKRALEVMRSTGRSIGEWRKEKTGGIGDMIALRPLILLPDREWLYIRCNLRFEVMMEKGAVEEVAALVKRGLPDDAPIMRAIGVKEISTMLRGDISRDETMKRGQIATRQYAKRQYTWFRNQSPADWPCSPGNINDDSFSNIEILLQ